ncbi:hypothetical protein AVEN_154136-1 [Araneus ventricosus]|uniref:Uncharacterized protein n=1 Tax=Araneus ventricosus TaxID=182803 RepID=A0A4Y2MWQ2_ARAVE|nr:hypothetical protein AVEN_154136-1 [Araneus ventricosus]
MLRILLQTSLSELTASKNPVSGEFCRPRTCKHAALSLYKIGASRWVCSGKVSTLESAGFQAARNPIHHLLGPAMQLCAWCARQPWGQNALPGGEAWKGEKKAAQAALTRTCGSELRAASQNSPRVYFLQDGCKYYC